MPYKNVRKENGREFVTISEFADRLNTHVSNIKRFVEKNELATTNLHGCRYLDFEVEKLKYAKLMTKSKKNTGKSKKVAIKKNANNPDLPAIPKEDKPTLNKKEKPSKNDLTVNPDTLDAWLYPDCWVLDNQNEPIINPVTKKPFLEMQTLKNYLTAKNYQHELDVKTGKYIAKTDLVYSIKNLSAILATHLKTIPDKYGAELYAIIETIINKPLSNTQKKEIEGVFSRIPNIILKDVRKSLEAMENGE